MKIAIISDVHGNNYTFELAIKKIHEMNIDTILFVGDICGYYFDCLQIIDRLKDLKKVYAVRGNHDEIFLNIYKTKSETEATEYSSRYGSSIHDFLKDADKRHIEYLEKLPNRLDLTIDGLKITMYHGGPDDYLNQKVLPDNDMSCFKDEKADIVIIGHTHYRLKKIIDGIIILNPGSLGQPRDGLLPSFVVFETETKVCTFIDINYRVDKLIKDILIKGKQPKYLFNVLMRPYTF